MSGLRYFRHDFSDEPYRIPLETCLSAISTLTERLLARRCEDETVYVGETGVDYALLRVATAATVPFPTHGRRSIDRKGLLERLVQKVRDVARAGERVRTSRAWWSLYMGHAGIYATSALVLDQAATEQRNQGIEGDQLIQERNVSLQKLLDLSNYVTPFVAESEREPENEVLYGRAGYLLSVLSVQSIADVPSDLVIGVLRAMIDCGRYQSRKRGYSLPLYYEWPSGKRSKPYVGAAHGFMGILYTMLHFVEQLETLGELQAVQQCIYFVLDQECDEHGNFGAGGFYRSSLDSSHAPLVHWCHGSPAAVFFFVKAYEVFQEDSFLHAAIRSGEIVWQRGLLKKGPGFCHGVSGNGYALLSLYKVTHDEKYLTRASRFAEFMLAPQFQSANVPDSPWSLYEGWAGALCFLVDLLDPKNAKFPFFEF